MTFRVYSRELVRGLRLSIYLHGEETIAVYDDHTDVFKDQNTCIRVTKTVKTEIPADPINVTIESFGTFHPMTWVENETGVSFDEFHYFPDVVVKNDAGETYSVIMSFDNEVMDFYLEAVSVERFRPASYSPPRAPDMKLLSSFRAMHNFELYRKKHIFLSDSDRPWEVVYSRSNTNAVTISTATYTRLNFREWFKNLELQRITPYDMAGTFIVIHRYDDGSMEQHAYVATTAPSADKTNFIEVDQDVAGLDYYVNKYIELCNTKFDVDEEAQREEIYESRKNYHADSKLETFVDMFFMS